MHTEHCAANERHVRIQFKCLVIIYVLFPGNETVQPPYFQNRITMFCLTIPAHISMRDFYISRIGLSILLQPSMWTHPGNI
jgi:hypothetical protein